MVYQDSIFKVNDIRGIYPAQLNEDVVFKIGKALVKYLKCKNVVIARDARLSSGALFNLLAKGIISNGADVIDLGLVSTDAFYFAMGQFGFEAGVMITASHNPPQYNGLKICRQGPMIIYEGNGLEDLRRILEKNDFDILPPKEGQIVSQDIRKDYLGHLFSFIKEDRIKPLKVAIDASNGMAGLTIKDIAGKLPIQPFFLNINLDGTFPAHSPDCNDPVALKNISDVVLKNKLDFGVVFDGDADRVAFIDENGEYVDASVILVILIKHFLTSAPGSKVIYDSASSGIVKETIVRHGGIPVRAPIGHAFMKTAMRDNNALLGGEHTGHFYFKNNFYCDSGAIAFLIILELISVSGKTLSELKKETHPYFRSREKNYPRKEKYEQKLAQVEKYYFEKGAEIEYYDGLIINGKDFWIHIHPANTEPVIRINIEAGTSQFLESKQKELELLFKQTELI